MPKQGTKKTKYQPEQKWHDHFVEVAEKLCREGKSVKALAKIFEVSMRTIHYWNHRHPEFRTAILAGRDYFRNEVMEDTLFSLAKGGKTITKDEYRKIKNEETGEEEFILVKKTKETSEPNLGAIKHILNNTHPEERFNENKDVKVTFGDGFGKAVERIASEMALEELPSKGDSDESIHSANGE